MAQITSIFGEQLVQCTIDELTSVPPYPDAEEIALRGTPAQVHVAAKIRVVKMPEWKTDLPPLVFQAIRGIADSTWWFANQYLESSQIKWPKSWTGAGAAPRQAELPPAALNASRDRVLAATPKASATDIEEFEHFARRVCQMPEMAYLTMMALLYRQTKDDRLLARITESRLKINGYLNAIDDILGPPGS